MNKEEMANARTWLMGLRRALDKSDWEHVGSGVAHMARLVELLDRLEGDGDWWRRMEMRVHKFVFFVPNLADGRKYPIGVLVKDGQTLKFVEAKKLPTDDELPTPDSEEVAIRRGLFLRALLRRLRAGQWVKYPRCEVTTLGNHIDFEDPTPVIKVTEGNAQGAAMEVQRLTEELRRTKWMLEKTRELQALGGYDEIPGDGGGEA